jgi:hypothetical protein
METATGELVSLVVAIDKVELVGGALFGHTQYKLAVWHDTAEWQVSRRCALRQPGDACRGGAAGARAHAPGF